MESTGKLLLLAAAILAAVGLGMLLAAKFGLPRLPGDIVIRRDNFTLYMPLGLMIVLSLLASLIVTVLRRF